MKIKINVTAIFLVVLYGVEALSLILREEHWLRLCENGVLRKIFGPKRDEVTEAWRCLHDEHLYDLYSSSNTRVGNLIVATIYLQLIQNRYMFRSFTVLQCSH